MCGANIGFFDFMQHAYTCRVQNPDIPRAGRVGAHDGVAGRSRAGLFANRTVRLGNNPSPHPPKASKTRRLNVSPEAQTSESQCKPMGEQNPRLNRGSSPVYHRDEKRPFFLAADQWTDLFCLCKHFSCRACPGIYITLGFVCIALGKANRIKKMKTQGRTIASVPELSICFHRPKRQKRNNLDTTAAANNYLSSSFIFKIKKQGHTTGGSGRSGARRGGGVGRARQDGQPTGRFALEITDPSSPGRWGQLS